MKRVFTAAVSLPLVIGIVQWGPPALWAGLVGLAVALGTWEFGGLARAYGIRIHRPLAVVLGVGSCAAFLDADRAGQWILLLLVSTVAAVLLHVLARGTREDSLAVAAGTLLAGIYPGLLLSFVVGLRSAPGEAGRGAVFFLIAVIWSSDTFSYYGGRALGRHKLAPTLSPKKTVEGAIAGVLGAMLGAVACAHWLFPEIGSAAAPAGAVLAILAIAGDLVESALKRGAGVKDTGTILPGHGGVLDRLDSMLLAAPAFYYYYQWAIR